MKTRSGMSILLLMAVSSSVLLPSFSGIAEARIGGGSRSSGSRGFRGFSQPRPAAPYSSPNRDARPDTRGYGSPNGGNPSAFQSASRSPFMSGLAGGLAGGMLGSMLFRNSSYGGMGGGMGGGGGMGFLDILLIGGLIYFAYQLYRKRSQNQYERPAYSGAYEKVQSLRGTGPYARESVIEVQNESNEPQNESGWGEVIRRYDPSFDLTNFKDGRLDDFMKIQAAWNYRDLSSVNSMIAPELSTSLQSDIEELKRAGKINKVENIAVRGTELIEAWQEYGKEFATVRFRASLTDYTLDEKTQEVVMGDRLTPVKFLEDWTFVRSASDARTPWQVSAIQPLNESAA